ncbi:metal-dependent hydrolase [Roseivivax sp. THAF40]|uniref:metal-dependent hydrolase n=1 Tax=unclassified Roseivivax TaxID=2639302 RepID=UPI0012682DC1|nr:MULTISPECIES: metal-dependent hydrolase [unclassified Roseivivax]QFS83439.1 metal-dependent hydrolase [Roseivivax sp. THAF197b]QFT47184.1 metal-dependent hydrolase [Roseivivax sp. THAF40]
MKITFLGHASFRIEAADAVILLDPWLAGNPAFPDDQRAAALEGATHILLTHAHFDHADEVMDIARDTGAPVVAIADLAGYLGSQGLETMGFNKGGTVDLAGVKVTMVHATHSSTFNTEAGPVATGSECGYMIEADGHTVYVSGDTDVMADMKVFNDLHAPDTGILCAGGHFTMDMKRAAYAAKTFFNFKTVIPCHYKTFPALEQSADALKAGLPGVNVIEPEVMTPITL